MYGRFPSKTRSSARASHGGYRKRAYLRRFPKRRFTGRKVGRARTAYRKGPYRRRAASRFITKKDLTRPRSGLRASIILASATIDKYHVFITNGLAYTVGAQSYDYTFCNDPALLYALAGAGGGIGATGRLAIKSYTTSTTYKSMNVSGFRYKTFYCKSRGVTPLNETNLGSLFALGMSEATSLGTSTSALRPPLNMWDSTRFLHYFKIYKVRSGKVECGRQMVVKLKEKFPRQYLIGPLAKALTIPSTRFAFTIFQGDPVNDGTGSSSSGGTPPNFSTSHGFIDFFDDVQVEYAYASAQAVNYAPSFGTLSSASAAQMIPCEASGAVSETYDAHAWNSYPS